ncbi:MAG: DUF91 domain-containing protein, partial [Gemmatimonadaceae bacterium]|nr:DUF91 domain-containing protein [Gloeobacterales cyanobacterium ES-bin-141]
MLKHSAGRWVFVSEQALEGFLSEHLEELGLTLLQRQYVAVEDRSDLLAVDESGALVILELKNVEDSGIVAQLTRYYSTVIQERPHSGRVDYSLPVRLIAIAPGFRRQNFVDRKYSRLDFVFLRHSIEENATGLTLHLTDVDGGQADVLIPVEGEYARPDPAAEISNRILKGIV